MASLKDAAKYFSLSDAIQTLKAELVKAEATAKDRKDGLLLFKECEIELSLEFNPSVEAGVNIGFFKIKAGAGATGGHKIKVKFEADRPLVAFAGKRFSGPKELGPPRPVSTRPKLQPKGRHVP